MDLEKLNKIFLKDDKDYTEFRKTYSNFRKYFKGIEATDIWHFYSDVALNDIVKRNLEKNASKPRYDQINQIYWSDVFQSINAAKCIFLKRASTLLGSSFLLLKNKDFLSSAILARSLLEICMWHVYHSSMFKGSVTKINKNPKKHLIQSPQLQDQILKLIWGTNEKNVIDELKQHKIYKIFDQVAKGLKKTSNTDIDLEEFYDLLCEFVHPNVEGNNLFVDFDINAQKKPVIPVAFKISKKQEKNKEAEPDKLVLKTLTWSMNAMGAASSNYDITLRSLVNKFDTKKEGIKTLKRPKRLQ